MTQELDSKFILVISSYSPIKEGGRHLISSFTNELAENSDIRVSVEYMDCDSSPEFDSWVGWMRRMFSAYKIQPELVVLLGNEAWSAYRLCCVESWRNVPIVLGGVKKVFLDYKQGLENFHDLDSVSLIDDSFEGFSLTGYYYQDYIEENVRLIKRLQPHVNKVAFCFDNRYSIGFFKGYLLDVFAKIDDLDLCYLSGDQLSTVDLLDTISQMDDHYALLSAGWYTDVNRYSHSYSMFHSELSRFTEKFVYEVLDEDFSNMNYLGGYFVSGHEVGSDLADLTYQVLTKGIERAPSFRVTPSPPRYHINYPVLLESGIDPDNLPADVVYYNKKPSLLEERPLEIVLVLLLIVMMCLLFGLILRYRKRREEGYKTRNNWLMGLLGSMPDMAVIYDSAQNIVDIINPQEILLAGYAREDLIGKNTNQIEQKNEDFRKVVTQIIENVNHTARSREVCTFSYEIEYKDAVYYAQGRTVPFGKDYVICFAHDVTQIMVGEKELLKIKTFFQFVVDNLPIGLFVKEVTNDYRYLYYNEKMAKFHKDDFLYESGKNDFELNDPFAAKYREEDLIVEQSTYPTTFDRIIYDVKGQPCRWGICTKSLCVNNDGSKYIIATITDTTEDRKKEFELDEMRKELLLALEAGSMSAWEYDLKNDRLTFLNSSSLNCLGELETLEDYLALVHPDDVHLLQERLTDMIEGRTKWVNNLELRVKVPGEEQLCWHEIDGLASEFDRDKQVSRIIGVRRDITRLKMTDELIELRNKAEESNRLKSAFLANMSHEIRTPLNAIVGFSNLIMESDNKENINEYCRIIETNNDLLLQLINDILDLSKIEAGQIEFNYSEFPLREIFDTLEPIFRSRVKEGVRLECILPGNPCLIHSEKNRLTQVLSNFLSNACKFTSEGYIRMGYEYVEGGLRFYVKDTGRGINAENIPNVFNRFAKFDSFVQGTGLGLSICESIVQCLEGEIGVISEVGKGTEFWFMLPCEPVQLTEDENK